MPHNLCYTPCCTPYYSPQYSMPYPYFTPPYISCCAPHPRDTSCPSPVVPPTLVVPPPAWCCAPFPSCAVWGGRGRGRAAGGLRGAGVTRGKMVKAVRESRGGMSRHPVYRRPGAVLSSAWGDQPSQEERQPPPVPSLPPRCPLAAPPPGRPGQPGSPLLTPQAPGFPGAALTSPPGCQVPAGRRSCGSPSFPSLGPAAAALAQVPGEARSRAVSRSQRPASPVICSPLHRGCRSPRRHPRFQGSCTWPRCPRVPMGKQRRNIWRAPGSNCHRLPRPGPRAKPSSPSSPSSLPREAVKQLSSRAYFSPSINSENKEPKYPRRSIPRPQTSRFYSRCCLPPSAPAPARSRGGTEGNRSFWPHLGPILASTPLEVSHSKGQGRIYGP